MLLPEGDASSMSSRNRVGTVHHVVVPHTRAHPSHFPPAFSPAAWPWQQRSPPPRVSLSTALRRRRRARPPAFSPSASARRRLALRPRTSPERLPAGRPLERRLLPFPPRPRSRSLPHPPGPSASWPTSPKRLAAPAVARRLAPSFFSRSFVAAARRSRASRESRGRPSSSRPAATPFARRPSCGRGRRRCAAQVGFRSRTANRLDGAGKFGGIPCFGGTTESLLLVRRRAGSRGTRIGCGRRRRRRPCFPRRRRLRWRDWAVAAITVVDRRRAPPLSESSTGGGGGVAAASSDLNTTYALVRVAAATSGRYEPCPRVPYYLVSTGTERAGRTPTGGLGEERAKAPCRDAHEGRLPTKTCGGAEGASSPAAFASLSAASDAAGASSHPQRRHRAPPSPPASEPRGRRRPPPPPISSCRGGRARPRAYAAAAASNASASSSSRRDLDATLSLLALSAGLRVAVRVAVGVGRVVAAGATLRRGVRRARRWWRGAPRGGRSRGGAPPGSSPSRRRRSSLRRGLHRCPSCR